MNNLEVWDKLCQPPPAALKEIKGGRLSGKTDINPQWRMKAMTEAFGPVGFGWNYSVVRTWTEAGNDGQVLAFVEVAVVYKLADEWSLPVPGIGGSFLVEKEKAGLHPDDDCYKKAVTDALSVAFKAIGVAANIYMGLDDGAKYSGGSGGAAGSSTTTTSPEPGEPPEANKNFLSAIAKRLIAAKNSKLISEKEFTDWQTRAIDVLLSLQQLQNISGEVDKLIASRGQEGS